MRKLGISQMENLQGGFDWGKCIGAGSGAAILATQSGAVAAGAAFAGWGGLAVLGVAFVAGCAASNP